MTMSYLNEGVLFCFIASLVLDHRLQAALIANSYAARSSAINSNSDDACDADGAVAMFTVVPQSNALSNIGASDAVGACSSGCFCLAGSAWLLTILPLTSEHHYYSVCLHYYS